MEAVKMKERLILEIGEKRYIAVVKKEYSCTGCSFSDDEDCPEIISKIECGNIIWKELKEEK